MKTALPLLAFAATTSLGTLALSRSAHADEVAPSVAPRVEAKPVLAPAPSAACTVEESSVEVNADASERRRVRRRDVGVGLTLGGIAAGAACVPLFAYGASELSTCTPGWFGGGCMEGELAMAGGVFSAIASVSLLSVGIPLWASNAGEATPSSAELGIGAGSFELRGSF